MTDWKKLYSELKKEEQHLNSKVLIVDALNSYIRCFAAVPSMNDHGDHIGGMVGFLKSIGLAIRTIKPTRCILVFDGKGGSQRRRKLFPEYKENRKTMTRLNRTYDFKNKEEEADAMKKQLMILIEILGHLPVSTFAVDNVEADDVIAYIAHHIRDEKKGKSIIMSTDKDFLQIVSNNIEVWNPIKKKLYTPDSIVAEYGIHPNNFIIYRILDGDKSDNIPGVRGVGLKKLTKYFPQLAKEEQTMIPDLLTFSGLQKKGKIFESIVANQDIIERNYDLMRLDQVQMSDTTKMKVINQLEQVPPGMNKFQLTKLFQQYKLWNSFTNYDEWLFMTFQPLMRFSLTENKTE